MWGARPESSMGFSLNFKIYTQFDVAVRPILRQAIGIAGAVV